MTKRRFIKELEKHEKEIIEDVNSKIKNGSISDVFDTRHELRYAFKKAINSIIGPKYQIEEHDIDVVGGGLLPYFTVHVFNVKCGKFMKSFGFEVACYTEEA